MNKLKQLIFLITLATYSGIVLAQELSQDSHTTPLISINHGNLEALTQIKGLGKGKAQAIIHYRELHGPFTSLQDLSKVKGLGKKIVKKITPQLTLE